MCVSMRSESHVPSLVQVPRSALDQAVSEATTIRNAASVAGLLRDKDVTTMGKSNRTPAVYEGREQALVKHVLLQSYLEKLFLIIGTGARRSEPVELCYVDCFAGPWGGNEETLEGTSIAISLNTLHTCREKLASLGISANIRALYVEREPQAFSRLSTHLKRATPEGLVADCLHGDFVLLRDEILQWCGSTAFTFFFIDPKGWKPVGINILRPLLLRRRSEFLINFIYDFINRTASMAEYQHDMAEFLGEAVDLSEMAPAERERCLLGTYRRHLTQRVPSTKSEYKARTAYVRVMDRTRERTKYHLVYLTSHPVGVIEFMDISQDVHLVQQQVRAQTRTDLREKRTGMRDLFADQTPDETDISQVDAAAVDDYWLDYLVSGARLIGRGEFADILEQTDWMPRDLQASLLRLLKAGRIRNLDAGTTARHKKPLHFEKGERLELVELGTTR